MIAEAKPILTDRAGHPKRLRQLLAWLVHFYTALGLVAAAGIAVALVDHPGPAAFRWCFILMLIATLIDATDGTFARLVRVKKVLPGFDGRRLDDLIDFQTYTSLPLLLIYQAGLLPAGQGYWLLGPLLASAYGFSQTDAKTEDGHFVGFPSYWNIVAFYLYTLQPPPAVTIVLLESLALLTFVPSLYLYPTQRGWLNGLTCLLGLFWCILVVWLLVQWPDDPAKAPGYQLLVQLSLAYPIYYLVVSWLVTLRRWRSKPAPSN
jgi:phosphatidylcholine synthase